VATQPAQPLAEARTIPEAGDDARVVRYVEPKVPGEQ
jgi:hypothetical protein